MSILCQSDVKKVVQSFKTEIVQSWIDEGSFVQLPQWNEHRITIFDFMSEFIEALIPLLDRASFDVELSREMGRRYARLQRKLNRLPHDSIIDFQQLHNVLLFIIEAQTEVSAKDYEIIRRWMDYGLLHAAMEQAAIIFEEGAHERELREAFVLAVAHDLRSPLTGIRANAELILRYPDRKDRCKILAGRIVAGTDRLDRMVSNLLDANQIRTGRPLVLDFTEGDLVPLIHDTLENLATTHGRRFVLDLPSQIVGVWSQDGVQRVLENLITNALKYGAHSSPISIHASATVDWIQFSVHNHGNPISSEDQAGLFQLYVRTQAAKGSGKKGWGIGLVLVKGIVEAHGGHVEVLSDPVAGTTFNVNMPRIHPSVEVGISESTDAPGLTRTLSQTSN